MKLSVMIMGLLLSFAAHAELSLTASQIARKQVTICQSLEQGIKNAADLSQAFDVASDTARAKSFDDLKEVLLTQFKSLQCQSQMDALAQVCIQANAELDRAIQNAISSMTAPDFGEKASEHLDAVRAKVKKLGCLK